MKILADKVCCIGDLHLGIHQNSQFWKDIAIEWVNFLKLTLQSHNIKDIIICGDFFHYREEINVSTLDFASDILMCLKEFNIIMLVGNHDAYYKDNSNTHSLSIFKGWNNISIIDKTSPLTYEYKGDKLVFVPWGVNANAIPKGDIVFGHFEIDSFKMNQAKICTKGFESDIFLEKSNLIITGHFHHRQDRKYSKGRILYLGNPFQMDFGDIGDEKGIYLLNIPDQKLEFIPNNISPVHHKLYLSELAKIGNITNSVKQDITGNIIKFIVDTNIKNDELEFLLKKIELLGPKQLSTDSLNQSYDDTETNEEILDTVDIQTMICEFVDAHVDSPYKENALSYTLELYKQFK